MLETHSGSEIKEKMSDYNKGLPPFLMERSQFHLHHTHYFQLAHRLFLFIKINEELPLGRCTEPTITAVKNLCIFFLVPAPGCCYPSEVQVMPCEVSPPPLPSQL